MLFISTSKIRFSIVILLFVTPFSFADGKFSNISTRGVIGTGDDVLIAGFIISGTSSKQVLIRARGPSIADVAPNLAGLLSNPFVQLFDSSGQVISTNDDWQTDSNSAQIESSLRPTDSREAALLITLAPGPYTAIVRGVGGTTGLGIVEVFDTEPRAIDLGGVWNGTSTSDQGFPNQDFSLITTPDGIFSAISITTGAIFVGNIAVNSNGVVSGTGIGIPADGFAWIDGSRSTPVSFEGTFSEQNRLVATWQTVSTGESGTLDFAYDPVHQRDSSVIPFQGNWVTLEQVALAQGSGLPLASGTIDSNFTFSDGFFSGSDNLNCVYQGSVLTRNSDFNLYNISLTATGCEFAGNYRGLGVLIDVQTPGGATVPNGGFATILFNGRDFVSDVLFRS